ncbi:hypothetical protein PQ465_19940 [Sphingobacterium oryzagri]|uniref:Uncharacterized protein n=1 Tax=Sphingobacterium oryzagri TaxID=3025669 RepID=A0ABY7WFY8_9SPHI|nr:hypothetical protein [Sphingobacterium sp. KACC 22765]WDF68554.1 hypothetical protein PQ465_19940 [Sphingobacterium sp. KACC 22765]
MRNSHKINNLQDLKAEIARVSLRKREQEAYLVDQYTLLKVKVESPIRFVRNLTGSIPGATAVKGVASSIGKAMQGKDADWLTSVLQIGTPLVLNTTLLRNAGWLKKAMVLLASETAIGQVNQSKISNFIGKITSFIKPKVKKKKKKNKEVIAETFVEDESPAFGLPTNSETY